MTLATPSRKRWDENVPGCKPAAAQRQRTEQEAARGAGERSWGSAALCPQVYQEGARGEPGTALGGRGNGSRFCIGKAPLE